MKKIIILFAISLIVSGCAQPTPSESQIQTAIAKTNSSLPTVGVTPTPFDTDTPVPSPTSTETPDPCPYTDAVNFDNEINSNLKDYSSVMQLLAVTVDSTKLLAQTKMVEIRTKTSQLEYPPCGEPVYDAALAFMDNALDWSNSLVKKESSQQKNTKLQNMTKALQDYADAVIKFREEAGITK